MRNVYELNMDELVSVYNSATADKGIEPVKKFKDLKTGQSRVIAALKSDQVDLPAAKPNGEATPTPEKGKAKAKAAPAKGKAAAPAKGKGKAAAPAKGKATPAPKKESAGNDEFGVRIGSNRHLLFNLLKKRMNKPVSMEDAIHAVYGDAENGISAIGGVIKGCELTAPNGGCKLTKAGAGIKATLTLSKK